MNDIQDTIPGCRGWCNQGRQHYSTPRLCRAGRTMHRVIEVLSHPTDEVLRSGTLDQINDERRELDRDLWALAALFSASAALVRWIAYSVAQMVAGWMA